MNESDCMFTLARDPNLERSGVKRELVEKIINALREEKVSYAEAYETLEATYQMLKYRSQFLHL